MYVQHDIAFTRVVIFESFHEKRFWNYVEHRVASVPSQTTGGFLHATNDPQ